MKDRVFKTDDLRLARVRYFDSKHHGTEFLADVEAYAFLEKVGEQFVNIFDPTDGLAVFDRLIYPNVDAYGYPYGNKLRHVCGEEVDGACYVIEKESVKNLMKSDEITLKQLTDYVLKSEHFFVDRIALWKQERPGSRLRLLSKHLQDEKLLAQLQQYIANHEGAKQYVKRGNL